MRPATRKRAGTAPSIAEVADQDVWDAVKEFSAYFPLNPAKRGKFKGIKDGVKVVSTHDGKPFTPEIAYAHLSGFFAPKPGKADLRTSIKAWGQLPGWITDAGKHVTNVLCLDLDAKDFSNLEPDAMDNARLSLQAVASDYGAALYSETSISGSGQHCWLFLKEDVSLSNARAIGRGLARLAGLHNADTLEVNPKGDDLNSSWIIMPYARAMTDSENPGLGLTYLVTPDGEPVPVTELSEWITRADNNRLMDLLAEGLSETEDATPSPTGATTADLKPEALQLLKTAAENPPETFARHASLNAFLNLARRCEGLPEMAEHLKSEAVFNAWVTDGSRTRETWAKEIDRWVIAAKHPKKERGIPFLVQQGFELPDLPAARPTKEGEGTTSKDEDDRKSLTEKLADLAKQKAVELFKDPDNETFITIRRGDHYETHRLRSKPTGLWLRWLAHTKLKKSATAQTVQDVIATLEGIALFDGKCHEVFTRLAKVGDAIYLDLCNDAWEVVKITPAGWTVEKHSPVKFIRYRAMAALPAPQGGGSLADLYSLANVPEVDRPLVNAWLVGCMNPDIPYPLLLLHGQQGSGKSTTAKLLRAIIDPSTAPLRSVPKGSRDLMIQARSCWIPTFDNASGISQAMSDALCILSTGGGFATRTLFTDADETILNAKRPVILTAITDVANRGDLLDRCIIVNLEPIQDSERRTEASVMQAFAAAQPRIFGALLNATSTALRRLPETKLTNLPRMADFAQWAAAGESALPQPVGAFMSAYSQNREAAHDLALDPSPVAPVLRALMATQSDKWEGTATDLLQALGKRLEQDGDTTTPKLREYPKRADKLSAQLKRLAPNLLAVGLRVTFGRESTGKKRRLVSISKVGESSVTSDTGVTTPEKSRPVKQNSGDATSVTRDATVTLDKKLASPEKSRPVKQNSDQIPPGDASDAKLPLLQKSVDDWGDL